MSKEQLMSQEERSFQEYLGKIHGAYTSEKLSYFEHNLEVTDGGWSRDSVILAFWFSSRRTEDSLCSGLFRHGGSCGGC